MNSNSKRMFSDEEWARIRDGWKANSDAASSILKLVQNDYEPGSARHKRLDAVIKREKMEIDLILMLLGKVQAIDDILHPAGKPA